MKRIWIVIIAALVLAAGTTAVVLADFGQKNEERPYEREGLAAMDKLDAFLQKNDASAYFGGSAVDEEGRLVVYLHQGMEGAKSLMKTLEPYGEAVLIKEADWTYEELREWKEFILDTLKKEGIAWHGIGIGEQVVDLILPAPLPEEIRACWESRGFFAVNYAVTENYQSRDD